MLHLSEVSDTRLRISVVRLGRAEVEALLARNTNNRKLKAKAVKRYTEKIATGRMAESVLWIAGYLDTEEWALLDGQHRLRGFLEADDVAGPGVTQEFVIIEGLTLDDQDHLDSNVLRSPYDQLTRHGIENASSLGSHVRFSILVEAGDPRGVQVSPDTEDIVTYVQKHKDSLAVFEEAIRTGYRVHRHLDNQGRPQAFGVGYRMFHAIDPGDTVIFFERLIAEEGAFRGDPVFYLRRTIEKAYGTGKRASTPWTSWRLYAVMILAWNDMRDNRTRSSVYRFDDPSADFPEPH